MRRVLSGPKVRGVFVIVVAAVFLSTLSDGRIQADSGRVDQPPKLLTFDVVQSEPGVYTLTGTLEDEWPEGCYIAFGGTLAGWYGMVYSDGSYGESFEIDFMEAGSVSAQVVDPYGYESNILWNEIL